MPAAIEGAPLDPDRPGDHMLVRIWDGGPHRGSNPVIGSRDEDALRTRLIECPCNRSSLVRGLPLTQDHFGCALAELAMGVHTGEAEISVRELDEPFDGV